MKSVFFVALLALLPIKSWGDIHCRFDSTNGNPSVYLRWNGVTHKVWILSGWPQTWTDYKRITVFTGLPPYMDKGFTLVAFAKVPMIHLWKSGTATSPMFRGRLFPYEATWGEAAGGPNEPGLRGICWSMDDPPESVMPVYQPDAIPEPPPVGPPLDITPPGARP